MQNCDVAVLAKYGFNRAGLRWGWSLFFKGTSIILRSR